MATHLWFQITGQVLLQLQEGVRLSGGTARGEHAAALHIDQAGVDPQHLTQIEVAAQKMIDGILHFDAAACKTCCSSLMLFTRFEARRCSRNAEDAMMGA